MINLICNLSHKKKHIMFEQGLPKSKAKCKPKFILKDNNVSSRVQRLLLCWEIRKWKNDRKWTTWQALNLVGNCQKKTKCCQIFKYLYQETSYIGWQSSILTIHWLLYRHCLYTNQWIYQSIYHQYGHCPYWWYH